MKRNELAAGLPPVSALGLGCSRLGSMTADQTAAEARALIVGALDLGVNVFDTANIYGQGRSERLLGEATKGVEGVCIITKAGFVFPLRQRLLAPLRGPVSALLKRSQTAQTGLRSVRSQGLPRNFQPEHLTRALEQSLRRLKRDQVEIFLLHSPRAHDLADGAALDTLQQLKRRGLARLVGVSCDDIDTLDAVARDPRVEAIEAPFGLGRRQMEASLSSAAERGVIVIAREVLSAEPPAERPAVADAVKFCTTHPGVSMTLVGTGKLAHLREAVEATS